LNDIFGIWWRRAALYSWGIGIIRTRERRAFYHPRTVQVHQRRDDRFEVVNMLEGHRDIITYFYNETTS
jgi:hypothetical protein